MSDICQRTRTGNAANAYVFFAKHFSIAASRGGTRFEEVEYVDGIENPSEAFPNIVRWLVRHGYSDADIGRAIGGNVLQALAKVWPR